FWDRHYARSIRGSVPPWHQGKRYGKFAATVVFLKWQDLITREEWVLQSGDSHTRDLSSVNQKIAAKISQFFWETVCRGGASRTVRRAHIVTLHNRGTTGTAQDRDYPLMCRFKAYTSLERW